MLILDSFPEVFRKKTRFFFDRRWINKPSIEEVVKQAWNETVIGSPMFQVAERIKRCRLALLKWDGKYMSNYVDRIKELKLK